jgi:transcription elongation factor GreA
MTTAQRVWITQQAHDRLQHELVALRRLIAGEATDDAEADENSVAIQRARQARIQQIHDVLLDAVVGEDPPDDGIAEPGMVLTVRYDETGETEIFLLGVRGAEYGDMEVYSVQSPLGTALLGAQPGERRSYQVPSGATVPVTLVKAVPYGLHANQSADAT